MDPQCVFHGDVPMTEVAKCSTFEIIMPNPMAPPSDPGETVTRTMSFETTPGSNHGTIKNTNCVYIGDESTCKDLPVTCDLSKTLFTGCKWPPLHDVITEHSES
jgi:hypothetical protein